MAIYENSYRGRPNRKESAKHLNTEFDNIETAFSSLDSLVKNSFTQNYVHTLSGGGTETINPENGRLQEITLTGDTTINISDPKADGTGNTSVSLLVHGSDVKIINGWGKQTWKEYGINNGLFLYTGSGLYASAILEFVWDGLAWVCVAATKNDNIGLTATKAHFLMLNSLSDVAGAETLGHTRTGPATGWDTNEAWHVFPANTERFAGARIADNWISEPSNLQGVGWTAVNATVATEAAAGPSSENVDKITFTAIDGEVNHWFLPDFGRYSTTADNMRFVVTFKAKMFGAVSTGTVRAVVSLMGSDTEAVLIPWARSAISVTDSWDTYGATFTISGDEDAYNLSKSFSQRTLTKLAIKAPSGSTGSPVMVTDVQFGIMKEGDDHLPSEFQESTIGSSLTLAATSGSTGSWTDGTKTLALSLGEYVDFQDSLDPGNKYLCVASVTGDAADVLMGADTTYWLGTYTGDTRYVASAPFTFFYTGGVFKFQQATGTSSSYTLNIYKISNNTSTYEVENGNSISAGVVTYADGPPVTNNIFSGYIHETDARANIFSADNYRNFDNWTQVNLGSGGATRGEYGIDGYPSHGSTLEAAMGTQNGYFELNLTVPDDTETYAFSMFTRLLTNLLGGSVYSPQYDGLTTGQSRYYDMSIKLTGGTTEVGGQVVRWWNYRDPDGADFIGEPSGHEYTKLSAVSYNKSSGESFWTQTTMSLLNNGSGNTNCRIRIWPAPGPTQTTGSIDVTTTGYIVCDWCQLEKVVTATQHTSSPLPGGESRGADALTTALADGDLYDANESVVGDITSGTFTFDATGIYKNIGWSTDSPVSTSAKSVHEFGISQSSLSITAPTDILGLVLWLDASDATVLFQTNLVDTGSNPVTADGQTVANWTDKSGGLKNVYQNGGNNEPVYRTSQQNGLSALQAKNTSGPQDHLLRTIDSPLTQDRNVTIFHVGALATAGSLNGTLYANTDMSANTNALYVQADDRAVSAAVPAGVSRHDGTNITTAAMPSKPGTGFVQVTNIVSNYVAKCRLNGVDGTDGATPATTGATANDAVYLFMDQTPSSTEHTLDFKLGEFIIYDRALTSLEITSVESYLKTKWATP